MIVEKQILERKLDFSSFLKLKKKKEVARFEKKGETAHAFVGRGEGGRGRGRERILSRLHTQHRAQHGV